MTTREILWTVTQLILGLIAGAVGTYAALMLL